MKNNKIKSSKLDDEYKLVLSGGGFKGYYDIGVGYVIHNFLNKDKIKGIIGTSAGALSAVYIACNIDMDLWKETYYISQSYYRNGKCLYDAVKDANETLLPPDAHIICNKYNVEIVATKISVNGLSTKIFKNFKSREELLNCILASICLPFIINSNYPYCQKIDDDYYIDGAILLNTPIEKMCKYNQLVIRNHYVNYPLKNMFIPNDDNINVLVCNGANDFVDFINNENNNTVFKIYNKNRNYKSFSKLKIMMNVITGITVLYSLKYIYKTRLYNFI